ncbi:MAG: esterase-like activity of phytase family protein [Mycobacterium sp.]
MSGIDIAVGRLGGLAVALGIGAAIAAAAPAAWAQDGEDAQRSSASRPTAGDSSPRTKLVGAAAISAKSRIAGARPATSPPAAQSVSTPVQIPAAATTVTAPPSTGPGSPRASKASPARPVWSRRERGPRRSTAAAGVVAQPGLMLTPTGQGLYPLTSGATDAAELSGITYDGGSTYYAVGDNGAKSIWQLATVLAAGFGWVNSGAVTTGISAAGLGSDSEGIALRTGTGTVWIADESTSTISEFSLGTGAKVGSVPVPEIYRPANVQNNLGLEALSYGAGKLWTANEEALKSDGALSTTRSGSWVRIQEFGGDDFAPGGQYAYRTEPIRAMSPFITVERSGLVDLLALPDGRVLSLERELGGFLPSFRTRVYLLDFSAATDVSALPSLTAGGFTPVRKTLLWQSVFLTNNFEGITLGPRLSDGTYSVLLVSDDGAGESRQRQDLFSLVLRGLPTVVV